MAKVTLNFAIPPLATFTDPDILSTLHCLCFAEGWSSSAFLGLLRSGAVAYGFSLPSGAIPIIAFCMIRSAADESEVLTFATHPDFRRQGLGTRLLQQVTAALIKQGITRVFLEVRADNLPAQQLYQQSGFLQIARRPEYYTLASGTCVDALVMEKLLFAHSGD